MFNEDLTSGTDHHLLTITESDVLKGNKNTTLSKHFQNLTGKSYKERDKIDTPNMQIQDHSPFWYRHKQ
jgi:hypothetical protein